MGKGERGKERGGGGGGSTYNLHKVAVPMQHVMILLHVEDALQ